MRVYATIFAALMALLVAGGAVFQSTGTSVIDAPSDQYSFIIYGSVIAHIQEILPHNAIHIVDGVVYLDDDQVAARDVYLSDPAPLCTCEPTVIPATVPETLGTATILTTAEAPSVVSSLPAVTPGLSGLTLSQSQITTVEAPSTAGITMTSTTISITHSAVLTGSNVTSTGASPTSSTVPTETPGNGVQKHAMDIVTTVLAFILAGFVLPFVV
ncbi:hypothetical protein UCRPA7_6008 [Phaeoacremonium minimum UCRPA7]|uniref:Uncharacterized protein n=1 Tax=Phaeoacremonium minimum (strain UCR-PA7) TaxID=1286976 RepID=R8BGS8_PHAM7|nr:hypothetical protein UCRPA7_6008 [Phaeoacremonium minimum UCRPA7]EON98489.1 hypothetical protein UCRPA7_6008 [Phaeoacremonium minimum UCRPA7]